MAFFVYVDGVDYGPAGEGVVTSLSCTGGGVNKVGKATVNIVYPLASGYTFRPTREVQIYETVGGQANGLFGGFVANISSSLIAGTSHRVVSLTCSDYGVLLDNIYKPAGDASVLIAHDTFENQIAAAVLEMQKNGDSAVHTSIDATTYVQALTGATSLPQVEIAPGDSLRMVLRKIMANAQADTTTLRPQFMLRLDSDGAGGVLCALVVYDAAAPTSSIGTWDLTPTGGEKRIAQYSRVLDSSMPLANKRELLWEGPTTTAVYTYTGATSAATYYNDYISHGLTGHRGYLTAPFTKASNKVTDATEAQAEVDRLGQATEYPRETLKIVFDKFASDTTFVRPGDTITVQLSPEGVSGDYAVADVGVEFRTKNDVSYQRFTYTCGLPLLKLFENGLDGITGAPSVEDTVPPDKPTSFALTYNLYNPQTGMADLTFAIGASPSLDLAGYVICETLLGREYQYDVGTNLAPTLSFDPGRSYSFTVRAYDGRRNLSVPASTILTGTTASPIWTSVPNASFEQVDRFDTTKPAYWTRTVVAGGTATLDTTAYDGTKAIKLLTAGGGTDSASFTSEDFMTGPLVKRPFVFFAKASNSSTSLGYTITWKDSAGSTLGTSTGTVTVGTSWARFSQAVVPTAACVKASIKFTNANTSARTIYVDVVSCENQIDGTGIEDGAVTGAKFNSTVTLTNQTVDFTSTSKITAGGGKVTVDANGIAVGNSSGSNNIDFYNDVGTRIGRAYSGGASGSGALVLEADYNGGGSTSLDVRAQDFVDIAVASTGGIITVGNDGITDGISLTTGASTKPITMGSGSVLVNPTALATNATDGFLYIPTCAGTPTGTPTTHGNGVALVYDTSGNFLYVYNGAWKKVAF